MRGIEPSDIELVAHVRPRHFADQFDAQPFGGDKAVVHRDQKGGGIHQRNVSDPKFCLAHLSNSAAVSTDCAISTIFLCSFMAVLRSSA